MRENPLFRAVLAAVAVSFLFVGAGYTVIGLWQMGYCAATGISVTELSDYMEEYSAHASRMATYMNIAMSCTALLIASLYFTLRRRSPIREMGVRRAEPMHLTGAALMGLGLQLPLGHLMELIPFPEEMVQRHEALASASASPVAVQVFYAVILAPVAEELLFRGVVHDRFSRALPLIPAAIISAAVFGVAHGETLSIIAATLCGFVLALLYERSGTVLVPVAFHIAFNAVGFAARSGVIPEGGWSTAATVLSVVLLAAGAVIFLTNTSGTGRARAETK